MLTRRSFFTATSAASGLALLGLPKMAFARAAGERRSLGGLEARRAERRAAQAEAHGGRKQRNPHAHADTPAFGSIGPVGHPPPSPGYASAP